MDKLVGALKAAGEPTRLRLLAALARAELTVSELTQVLGQSQPRVSRHLKLMCEAGLLDRFPEGAWAFFRLAEKGRGAALARRLVDLLPADDRTLQRDLERLAAVRAARAEAAAEYFRENAESWDAVRARFIPEAATEDALRALVGEAPIAAHLDLGVGAGAMLALFGPQAARAVGVDSSRAMLALARAMIAREGWAHVQARQGDLYDPPLEAGGFDLVTVHMVLHYLDDPARAILGAARMVAPGGRLVIADFAPHDRESLRAEHAHRRLGFPEAEVARWLVQAGLDPEPVTRVAPDGAAPEALPVTIWPATQPANAGGRAQLIRSGDRTAPPSAPKA